MQNILVRMNPTLLFLLTVLVFFILLIIGGFIFHAITCVVNGKTAMNGVMKMSVSLNSMPQNGEQILPGLECGEYLIGMADLEEMTTDLFFPLLGWREQAELRRYPVSVFLSRFLRAAQNSMGRDDPLCLLLRDLLKRGGFCGELGSISRRNGSKGLRTTAASYEKDKNNRDKLKIYGTIPENCGDVFRQNTQCEAKNMCITLEYLERGSV